MTIRGLATSIILLILLSVGCTVDDTSTKSSSAGNTGSSDGMRVVDAGAEFDELLKTSKNPILVQCYTPWCAKCRQLLPLLRQLEAEYTDKALFVKVNTAEADEFKARYHVVILPLLLFFKEGREQARLMGSVRESDIRDTLDGLLN
jgi:thioredoxin 1